MDFLRPGAPLRPLPAAPPVAGDPDGGGEEVRRRPGAATWRRWSPTTGSSRCSRCCWCSSRSSGSCSRATRAPAALGRELGAQPVPVDRQRAPRCTRCTATSLALVIGIVSSLLVGPGRHQGGPERVRPRLGGPVQGPAELPQVAVARARCCSCSSGCCSSSRRSPRAWSPAASAGPLRKIAGILRLAGAQLRRCSSPPSGC